MQTLTDPRRAAERLAEGALIVHPTQGLWGIAADPLSDAGMARLGRLKGGARTGFITVAAQASQLQGWYEDPHGVADKLLQVRWLGPVTFVLPAGARAPEPIVSADATVALRVTAHAGARDLARALGRGFASTSLNLPGEAPATAPTRIGAALAEHLDAVYDAPPAPAGAASTIVDLCGDHPRVLRPGLVDLPAILAVLAL